jgi:hypothetical protein
MDDDDGRHVIAIAHQRGAKNGTHGKKSLMLPLMSQTKKGRATPTCTMIISGLLRPQISYHHFFKRRAPFLHICIKDI